MIPLSKTIQNADGNISTFPYPPNIAAKMPKAFRERLFQWMLKTYIWPQIIARQVYEEKWDKLLRMAKAQIKQSDLRADLDSKLAEDRIRRKKQGNLKAGREDQAEIADTLIFDAIDRLSNLSHFIAFKEDLPGKFAIAPEFQETGAAPGYSNLQRLVTSANCWLGFCARNAGLPLEWKRSAAHHYTYGVAFTHSVLNYKVGTEYSWDGKALSEIQVLKNLTVTFKPISIRKIWLNPQLPVHDMELQGCPFFYDLTPRFAVTNNPYNEKTNPHGYVNLDALPQNSYLIGDQTLQSLQTAFRTANPKASFQSLANGFNNEMKWTLYPMIPLSFRPAEELSPEEIQGMNEADLHKVQTDGGIWDLDEDGKKGIPWSRFVVEMFGSNLFSGAVEFIKIQKNFYPDDLLPLYGSQYLPDCETGLYTSSIGDILESHYDNICKVLNQYMVNKDLLNDPPHKVMETSPAMNKKIKINTPSAKIPVNTPSDIVEMKITDGTQTTPQVYNMLVDRGQTTSKAVDAILGKAMGARTSATEAGNVFTTAMSGVTTDVNLFTNDMFGGYAKRALSYGTRFLDPDTLKMITGQYGFEISPEWKAIGMVLSCDAGSQFIETLTLINQIRYILEASRGEAGINRPKLWKKLLSAYKITGIEDIVDDGGYQMQVQLANEQAIQSYYGNLVLVDPDQDHLLAMNIKKAYLKDHNSAWNTNPQLARVGGPELVRQIQMHQGFLQIQQLQQQLLAYEQGTEGTNPNPRSGNQETV